MGSGIIQNIKYISNNSNIFLFLFFHFFTSIFLPNLVPTHTATYCKIIVMWVDLPDASVLWYVPHSLRREKDSLGPPHISYNKFIWSDETTHHTNTFRFVNRVFREILALCGDDFCHYSILVSLEEIGLHSIHAYTCASCDSSCDNYTINWRLDTYLTSARYPKRCVVGGKIQILERCRTTKLD